MNTLKNGTPRFRAGLVGAGHIAEFHVQALRRLPNVEIVGVADLDAQRARALAERFRLPATYASLSELLRQAVPDVVHVLTPPSAHADNTIEALQSGCHVMVEKPLASSPEDCNRIAAAAEAAGRTVCVDHSLLRDPFVCKAAAIVRSGAIGEVVGVDHLRSQEYPHYEGGRVPEMFRDGGFPFRDIGVHSLYLVEAFLGEIDDVAVELGSLENDGNPRVKEWRVLARCRKGLAQVYLSWNAQPLQNVLVIHGMRGVIRADIFGMAVTVRKKTRLPGHAERILNTMGEGRRMMTQVPVNVLRILAGRLRRYHGLQELVREFYEVLAAGGESPVTVSQARRIIHWTEQIAQVGDRAKQKYEQRFAPLAAEGTSDVLLTGATGFIGRHLLRRLLDEGRRVRILVRRTPEKAVSGNPAVEMLLGDLGNPDDVDRAMRGVREVYHLGATVEGHSEDFQCATIAGTRNIVESCLAHGVEKLIYMSSLSVIHAAAANNGAAITEDWPYEPYPERRGLYTQTKLEAERVVLEAVRAGGLRAVILRPGEVLGPDKVFLSGAVGRSVGGRVLVLGGGKGLVPVVWMEDLLDAVLAAAERGPFDGTVYNLVDPEQVTQDELAAWYLATTGGKRMPRHLPLVLLYTAAAGLDLGMNLLGRNSPITPYRLRSAIGTRHFDCAAAERILGWKPRIGVKRGMEEMVNVRAVQPVSKTNGERRV